MDELRNKYQAEIEKLESDDLREIVEDREKALEAARKGIEEVEPDNFSTEYLQDVATEMQNVAKMILEERTKN